MSGDYAARLRAVYGEKPEMVADFPDWMLSAEKIEGLRALPRAAVVEIAGRDSVAAALKCAEAEGFSDLIPTYVYTATEYGDFTCVAAAVARLAEHLPGIRVHDLLVLGSPGFWHALNGRYVRHLFRRFGFYSPCAGCHLYLHAVRVPLAAALGNIPIIAGEREFHGRQIKINQTGGMIDRYQALTAECGVPLLVPLRHVAQGREIDDILGFAWEAGGGQLQCVLSGNYLEADKTVAIGEERTGEFMDAFALPTVRKILVAYANGGRPDYLGLAAEVLGDA